MPVLEGRRDKGFVVVVKEFRKNVFEKNFPQIPAKYEVPGETVLEVVPGLNLVSFHTQRALECDDLLEPTNFRRENSNGVDVLLGNIDVDLGFTAKDDQSALSAPEKNLRSGFHAMPLDGTPDVTWRPEFFGVGHIELNSFGGGRA